MVVRCCDKDAMTQTLDWKGIQEHIDALPDEVITQIAFSSPWQYNPDDSSRQGTDEDGFSIGTNSDKTTGSYTRGQLQAECWNKFQQNPQVNTAVRGLVGRLAGMGFGVRSRVFEIQQVIAKTESDFRNRLQTFWPVYVGRAFIEGELFLMLSPNHTDGFVEVDFIDPATIKPKTALAANDTMKDGVLYHSRKALLPIVYNLDGGTPDTQVQVPSVYVAYEPGILHGQKGYTQKLLQKSKSRNAAYKNFGGYKQFIVSWNRGFMTRRSVSYLRTILEWLNHYENLKKYEIDHKKSAGAYVWAFTFEDKQAFRLWLTLSDEDKRKTALGAKMTPGGKMILPPGVTMKAEAPQLPNITESDTDILHMITSGLGEPEDVTTGQSKGTMASVKMSRGPMSDRISDEVAYFETFLREEFWKAILFFNVQAGILQPTYKIKEAIGFDSSQEPIFMDVEREPHELLKFTFPTSEVNDPEPIARALLGVKHGSTYDVAGLPMSEIVKKMGFSDYHTLRLQNATERDAYPELISVMEQESVQEQTEAEPPKRRIKK